ncbi:MAG: NADH:flavin oxidoreductase [Sphingomonadaceae bacterium]|nr:NADH:flavin oxidoreductase [Sphingomonadaceae bacterium]
MMLLPLFQPFQLGSIQLPNRIVMAPMTRQRSPDGVPGEDVADYYARRAAGGVGLIITEGTTIDDPAGSPAAAIPVFDRSSATGWALVRERAHAAGARIVPQLWHLGIQRQADRSPQPDEPSISPSGLLRPDKMVGAPMTEARILSVIEAFARGARLALELGFDGVELHGAHGYLIDQFFWEGTNARDDAWGADRTRFGAEIVRAVRAATAPHFPIILRWSQWKSGDYEAKIAHTPQALERFLVPLADAGVTAFHCSTRRFWEAEFPQSGSALNLAGWTKAITGVPSITVGSVGLLHADVMEAREQAVDVDIERLQMLSDAIERGDFDLVAIGRALLANPAWPALVREGRIDKLKAYSVEALESLL